MSVVPMKVTKDGFARPEPMTADHIARAARLWLAGMNSADIADALSLPEPLVAANSAAIRDLANTLRSRFHAH